MLALRRYIHFLDKLDRKLDWWMDPSRTMLRRVSTEDLQGDRLEFVTPYFVLSTGRCGTLWLSELMRMSSRSWVNHSDRPELVRHSRLAYEKHAEHPGLFHEILRAARDEFIIEAYRQNRTYIETNNRITFFARAIKYVYPHARFIHLVRHPGAFVRSGLSRDWYKGQAHDIGRITDVAHPQTWQTLSPIAKIAWLWNETNRYIAAFLETLAPETYLVVKTEEMFHHSTPALEILHFVGLEDISERQVVHMLGQKINRQRSWKVGAYATWAESEKAELRQYTPLAAQYGYEV